MNKKLKKYYQLPAQFSRDNKQNAGSKKAKNKIQSYKNISSQILYFSSKNSYLLPYAKDKSSLPANSCYLNHELNLIARSQSKRTGIEEPNWQNKNWEKDYNIKKKFIKLPKICKQQLFQFATVRKKHSKYSKKTVTEPQEKEFDIKTLNPQESMKQIFLKIVKKKENRQLDNSIDSQIQRLEALTHRYSSLRKDLTTIQQNMLALNYKHRYQLQGKQICNSNSTMFT